MDILIGYVNGVIDKSQVYSLYLKHNKTFYITYNYIPNYKVILNFENIKDVQSLDNMIITIPEMNGFYKINIYEDNKGFMGVNQLKSDMVV